MKQTKKAKYRHDYRAADYTITDLHLNFDLKDEYTIVIATSVVILQGPIGAPLLLDGENLQLLSLLVNNEDWIDYHLDTMGLIVKNLPTNFTLTIKTLIHPSKNTALEGLYLSGNTLCTQCEAEGFRHITFYLDRPDVLARFTTRIVADQQRYPFLLSNGNRIDYGDSNDGRHWAVWKDPFPKPCYLFALVAGDFDVLRDNFTTYSGKKVALELFVNRGNLNRTGWAMESLKRAMSWDETRFGLEYDLDIYMIVAVDCFNMGAMENKGLNIFNAKYILAHPKTATDTDYLNIERIIGHEYFHNWTGNRITCRDWFQLSLKEGLTVFRDQEFSSDIGSRAVNRINSVQVMRNEQFSEDASPMVHPIRPDKIIEVNNLYTLTVYEKGAEVIRMIHTLLGEKKFQAGMRRYISRHDGSSATCEDFVTAMEEAGDFDLTLFRRWYSQSGTPLVKVRDEYQPKSKLYILNITQITPPTADQIKKQELHALLDIKLYDTHGQAIPLQYNGTLINSVLNITQKTQKFIFDNVASPPIPSLLREFSSPVKLDYLYTEEQLMSLIRFETSEFCRWDAIQNLLSIYIRLNVFRYQQGKALKSSLHLINAFREILLNSDLDPALAALMLTLPSENQAAGLFDSVDPIAIHKVNNTLTYLLASELSNELLTVYQANLSSKYRINHRDIGQRALRNRCLHYLAFSNPNFAEYLITEQYYRADNMTDMLAAMAAAIAAQLPCQSTLLAKFDQQWHQDGLVMDKWFSLQAIRPTEDALDYVKSLLTHHAFTLDNPNRVRALIGTFTTNNPIAFHAIDGRGYTFLVETLIELNVRNPQIASRMSEPFMQFKRYDLTRQKLMRSALEKLRALNNLSNDLFEKISKALSDA